VPFLHLQPETAINRFFNHRIFIIYSSISINIQMNIG
jgi:hypothetical protein